MLSEDEDFKAAQMRKISSLIQKARVDKDHHILEIGFGWGSLAIEIVKQTGCKYTGITLSEEQLKYAETKVKETGLEFTSVPEGRYDDYRRSPGFIKEYIFPGLCVPSLTRLTSAMAASSRLWYVLKSSEITMLHCGACGKHRSTLLSNTRTLEEKLNAKPKKLSADSNILRV
uniref:Methyltransferase domain-containing protein n=1 Tax=Lactuca sativa TaxID=4236 RepID=A0A9R1V759_LACSA|nr:hypothetical protein LSAT_V11C600319780 [Lactuca sativa]